MKPQKKQKITHDNTMSTKLSRTNGNGISDEQKKEQEFSRFIAALGGKETLERIQKANVFLHGLQGLGAEVGMVLLSHFLPSSFSHSLFPAKNLVLMGVASLTIQDKGEVTMKDLSANVT